MERVHFGLRTALLAWQFGPFPLLVLVACIGAGVWYLRADWSLAARGRKWRPRRTGSFFAGLFSVDLALHLGEVLYGNVGATDRLDFTVIGPAVNEAARLEALCEPLGRSVLISQEFAAVAMSGDSRLESLGRHALRGVREPKEIFGLELGI